MTAKEDYVAWARIGALGRLQIPAALMKAVGIAGDEPVHVRASEDVSDADFGRE